jgi:hypothetical protein
MTIKILPDGSCLFLDEPGTKELADALGTSQCTRASHVYRDDRLILPWASRPVFAARSSDDGQWVVRLSFSPLNGRHAGRQLPARFQSRREAIQAEIRYIETEVIPCVQ